MFWQTTRFRIDLAQPQVMGIVNVTPDSFSDGGQHDHTAAALAHCEQLLRDGAQMLDIGAESTRPGAQPVPVEQELARLLPVLQAAVTLGVPISVDTYKPQVMQAALDVGVDIINDVWALRWADPAHPLAGPVVVAQHPSCGVCLMHMHREPQTMQAAPMQGDAVAQVLSFLERSAQELSALGVEKTRIALDPGVGFGKTVAQNFATLARQSEFLALGYPLLVGWSRKSSLAGMTAGAGTLDASQRMVPSVAAALLAIERGARIVRVHDVLQTAQAVKVWSAARA
ncbi:Dihydropteroate synthase [Rhodoferax sp. OV413]|uniref:dihydropteroate synthase n=1 Tax=Rhodoferax sp. OV413 TaxID=1855285 RepID=UPI00088826FA|nr:dihydropteroate synthase [Rhodoferax sp. OV413]SDP09479.1 Dihydropteroate synthase [Rhodoferax sp. OV413]